MHLDLNFISNRKNSDMRVLPKSNGFLKKYGSLVLGIQQFLDFLIIYFCLMFIAESVQPGIGYEQRYIILGLLACFLFTVIARSLGLYRSWRTQRFRSEFDLVILAFMLVIFSLFIIGYTLNVISDYSRLILTSWSISTPVALLLFRAITRLSLRGIRVSGLNTRKVAILGHGLLAQKLVMNIHNNDYMGMEIVGYYDDRKSPRESLDGVPPHMVVGGFRDAIEAAKTRQFDELYIALPMKAEQKIAQLISELGDCAVNVHFVPDLLTFSLINAQPSSVGNLPIVSIYKSPLDEDGMFVKNAEDFILSLLILSVIAVPMLLIALGIKLTSDGPVFFKQKRYGIGGQQITVWKFRTMVVTEDGGQVVQARKNDSRVTPFGRFLRKTSLDELPQFINVLQGQMSIVGPRPHAVMHNENYRKIINQYMLRHLVKPGITGLAQINGWRGETDSDEKMQKRIEYDLEYIRNWSLKLDLKIILVTLYKGFINPNAY